MEVMTLVLSGQPKRCIKLAVDPTNQPNLLLGKFQLFPVNCTKKNAGEFDSPAFKLLRVRYVRFSDATRLRR